jgi:hypothetical protein
MRLVLSGQTAAQIGSAAAALRAAIDGARS